MAREKTSAGWWGVAKALVVVAPLAVTAGAGCSDAGSDDDGSSGEGGESGSGGSGPTGGGEGSGVDACSALLTCTANPAFTCSGVACTSHTETAGGITTSERFCSDFAGNGCARTSCVIDGVAAGSVTCTGECEGRALEIGDGAGVCAVFAGGCLEDEDCTYANASGGACEEGRCNFDCDAGYADCDERGTNGCETDLNSPDTCGTSCEDRTVCSDENGTATCDDGACEIDCDAGYGDCEGENDGCETDLNSSATCGATCDDVTECEAGTETCTDGECESCSDGTGNCDERDENGCETDLTSPESCGTTCENEIRCSAENGDASCADGACAIDCNAGYGDCGGNNDGCETNLNLTAACGTTCDARVECESDVPECDAGTCREAPSCGGLEASCGAESDATCCRSLPVDGGGFYRGYDGVEYDARDYPASISDFRLDKFEISVGRFRNFVAAWNEGWRPEAGAGKHTHLNSGRGLVDESDGERFEPGWDADWSEFVEPSDENLACDTDPTWTDVPGENENQPMVCMNWYEAYAFCIWDGGFLPSEAEWHYAASGGSEQRVFPWSSPPSSTSIDCSYANYYSCGVEPKDVGSQSPQGDGRYGQSDLGGNANEWVLDAGGSYEESCDDCADLSFADDEEVSRQLRGGSYWDGRPMDLVNALHAANSSYSGTAENRSEDIGARCARTP